MVFLHSVIMTLATALACAAAGAAEIVTFPGVDVTLKASLHRPAGPFHQ
jgi:acyl-coenzyme A synthetase/AMP-(fatty) acid ligase